MTNLPYLIRQAMFSPNAADGIAALFTITRLAIFDALTGTLLADVTFRFTSHDGDFFDSDFVESGLVHLGDRYIYAGVSPPRRPDDVPGQLGEMDLVIENAVQDLGTLAENSVNGIMVILKHVAISDPDTIVEQFPAFQVLAITADLDANTITLRLTLDPIENEPANCARFAPDVCGALFP